MRSIWILLFAAIYTPWIGAQECSPIRFQGTITDTIFSRSPRTGYGFRREADGSFTKLIYSGVDPYSLLGSDPNYMETLLQCSEYQPGAKVPPQEAPSVGKGVLGIASRVATVFPLGNPSSLYGVGIYSRIAKDAVVFATANADGDPSGRVDYPVGENPMSLVVADFNGDNVLDVAVTYLGPFGQSNGGVSILLGNSNGSLHEAANLNLGILASSPPSVTAFDLNQDGNVDLAVSDPNKGGIHILFGDGSGSFAMPVFQALSGSPGQLIATDVNGDSRPDLLSVGFASNAPRLFVLLAQPGGTFAEAPGVALNAYPASLASGDLNKDGKVDLAISHRETGSVQVLLGDGEGGFSLGNAYQAAKSALNLHIMDFDWDGNPDVVVAGGDPAALTPNENSPEVAVLFGRGDGTFHGTPAFLVPEGLSSVTMADVNGDGRQEILAPSRNEILIFLAEAGGSFTRTALAAPALHFPNHVAAGDLNGDGITDLLVTVSATTGGLLYYQGNGDGSFQTPTPANTCGTPGELRLADLNGDSRLDAVVVCESTASTPENTRLSVLLGAGTGSFGPSVLFDAGPGARSLDVGDFNGDGKPDVAVAREYLDLATAQWSGGLTILHGTGDGGFEAPVHLQPLDSVSAVTAGDVNLDGKTDLVVAGSDNPFDFKAAVMLGDGAGAFETQSFLTDFGPQRIAVADFSMDGKPDLIVAHCCGSTTFIYHLGNGDGTFQPQVQFSVGGSPLSVAAGDLNGDGAPDLAALVSANRGNALAFLVNAAGQSTPLLTNVSAASFSGNRASPGSLVTGFGSHLATGTESAAAIPLPTVLAGSSVKFVDAAGQSFDAELLFINEAQVNYAVPEAAANGLAVVTVTAADGTVTSGFLTVADIAPAFFMFDGASRLVAAAVVRVKPDGSQVREDIFQLGPGNAVLPKPIDLGPDGDIVILEMYGTGIRGHAGLSFASATVGGEASPIHFAGAQGQFVGLDQVNLQLPRSLAGRGRVNVQLRLDNNVSTPPVMVEIQ